MGCFFLEHVAVFLSFVSVKWDFAILNRDNIFSEFLHIDDPNKAAFF